MIKSILICFNFLIAIALILYVYRLDHHKKSVFITNELVFNRFKGTKSMKERLATLRSDQAKSIDSLASFYDDSRLEQEKIRLQVFFENMSNQYTMEIWKQINQYISDYGHANDLNFIYGATGSGNLMFARDAYDITEEVIEYCNKRYEGDE